ncbi:MAG: hypothetical protein ABIH70_03735 [Chloroflexota bacterium]
MLEHRVRYLIPLAAVFLLLLGGCAKSVQQVNLNQEFTLSPGQAADIAGENLNIKFVEVITDSRCPSGATCVWAGEASCLVEITKTGDASSPYKLVLTEPGLTQEPLRQTFDGHELSFSIEPYPIVGQAISPSDYRLVMTVSLATPIQ